MQAVDDDKVQAILAEICHWVSGRGDILAVALVGSWASGAARQDADVDLVLLTSDPLRFRRDHGWITEIAWGNIGAGPAYWRDADYGLVWSCHVHLADGTEIEFGFGSPGWAAIDPVDQGTRQVIRAGCRILFDPQGLLNRLVDSVRGEERHGMERTPSETD